MENKKLNKTEHAEHAKKDHLKDLFDFVEIFAIAACAILIIFTFFTRLTVVDGGSMDTTLAEGQRLMISDLFTPQNKVISLLFSPLSFPANFPEKQSSSVSLQPRGKP